MNEEGSGARGWLESWCCSNTFFYYNDWRVFVYSPWGQCSRRNHTLYLVYRWVATCYFVFWLIWSLAHESLADYFIYLTNWTFVIFNLYLFMAALSVSFAFINTCRKEHQREDDAQLIKTAHPQSCGRSKNAAKWYHMVQWLLFTIGCEMSFLVFVYYWLVVYKEGPINGTGINTHLLNCIFALADLWVSGMPIKLLHVIYPIIYGAIYIVFTGVYHAITGKTIYNSLDYKNNPRSALLAVTAVVFAVPFVHVVIFYCQYKVKQDILQCFRKRRERRRWSMIQSVSFSNNEVILP